MILKRRDAPSWKERLRVWAWPRRSWARSLHYVYLRLMRMRAGPHQVALGCAIGVFASITPFVGVQMIGAGVLAYLLRANLAAAMLSTFISNPLTWPVIWTATYTVGCAMLSIPAGLNIDVFSSQMAEFGDAAARLSPDVIMSAGKMLWPVIYPMLIGSLPVGLAAAVAFYYVSQRAASSYAMRRAARLRAGLNAAYQSTSLAASNGPKI